MKLKMRRGLRKGGRDGARRAWGVARCTRAARCNWGGGGGERSRGRGVADGGVCVKFTYIRVGWG